MKNQLAILSTSCLLAANAVLLAPVAAQDTPPADVQPSVSFVCGQSYDPTSKTNVPTTLAVVEGKTEPFALIRWKSTYFAQYTPEKRCTISSPKFQAAHTAGKLNYLAAGTHKKTGLGIICALANADEKCDDNTNMLFTLKSYSSGDLVLSQLTGIFKGESNMPLYQSSGERKLVNMRILLKSLKK